MEALTICRGQPTISTAAVIGQTGRCVVDT